MRKLQLNEKQKKLNFYRPVSRVLNEYLAAEPPARERMRKEKALSLSHSSHAVATRNLLTGW